MNTMFRACVALALFASATIVNAQWYQNPINPPIAPGCAPGTSWIKSGLRYVCQTPKPIELPEPPPMPSGDPVRSYIDAAVLCWSTSYNQWEYWTNTNHLEVNTLNGVSTYVYQRIGNTPLYAYPAPELGGNGYFVVPAVICYDGDAPGGAFMGPGKGWGGYGPSGDGTVK